MLLLTEPSAIDPRGRAAEDRRQALDLDHVADLGAGAVRFDQRRPWPGSSPAFSQARCDGQHLADAGLAR